MRHRGSTTTVPRFGGTTCVGADHVLQMQSRANGVERRIGSTSLMRWYVGVASTALPNFVSRTRVFVRGANEFGLDDVRVDSRWHIRSSTQKRVGR